MLAKPALVLGTALALAGCSASSQSVIQNDESAVIAAIERDAKLACGVVVNVEDLGTLLSVADPTLAPAGAGITTVAKLYAAAVCNAAPSTAVSGRYRLGAPAVVVVDGVTLHLTPAK